jgi:hypothetical protein
MIISNHRFRRKTGFLVYFLFIFFYSVSIFDPSGFFYSLRSIAIILMFFFLISQICIYSSYKSFDLKYIIFLGVFAIFLPTYGLIISGIRGGFNGKFIDTSYIASALYLILSSAIFFRLNVFLACQILINVLRVLSALIFLVFLFKSFGMFPGFVYEFVFLDMAFIGERVYGGLNFPYIYFITSLALVFLVAHDAWRFFENKTIKEFSKSV